MMKYSLFILPILFFQYCRSQPIEKLPSNADENTLLWEISGNGLKKPSYLFGTFHLMCKEDIRFSPNLLKALKVTQEVYFEMDLDDPANTLGALFFVNMKNGKTLKDLYNEEDYDRLKHFFTDSLNMSMMMFQKIKPNFLQSFVFPKLMTCKQLSGVEQEVMLIANKEKKAIKGFETIAFQSGVFDSIPYEDQAKELLNMIDSIEAYSSYFNKMVNVYKSQQLSELETMLNDPEFTISDDSKNVLLDKRNKDWVHQLRKILPEKNIFMAVGAGHLVGKNGLINLLKQEGYTLRAIQNKALTQTSSQ